MQIAIMLMLLDLSMDMSCRLALTSEGWNLQNRNMQPTNLNFRASATSFNMPVNNTICSSDQYMAPQLQEGVSLFYPSAADSQYADSSPNMPMDGEIGHASISYLAGYP